MLQKPLKLRHMLGQYGEIGRLYLAPEDPGVRKKRKQMKGNTGKNFSEGWVEFMDKKIAKRVSLAHFSFPFPVLLFFSILHHTVKQYNFKDSTASSFGMCHNLFQSVDSTNIHRHSDFMDSDALTVGHSYSSTKGTCKTNLLVFFPNVQSLSCPSMSKIKALKFTRMASYSISWSVAAISLLFVLKSLYMTPTS